MTRAWSDPSRTKTLRAAIAVVAALAGGPLGAQAYDPVGPQTGVAVSTVEEGGWQLCFASPYAGETGLWLDAILAGCTGEDLMLACAPVGESTLTLLAQGPRSEVITDTGGGPTDSHVVNGSQWYLHAEGAGERSWGFADVGDVIDRLPCDYLDATDPNRLCWHIFEGGYRCGATVDLHTSTSWAKLVYQFTPWIGHDDFESGDLCGWHLAVGAAGGCGRSVTLGAGPECGGVIADGGPYDLAPDAGFIGYRLSWTELRPETAVRLQVTHATGLGTEDDWVELAEGTAQSPVFLCESPYDCAWTWRVIAHLGHEPGHGGTPIAGDVVSNACTVLMGE